MEIGLFDSQTPFPAFQIIIISHTESMFHDLKVDLKYNTLNIDLLFPNVMFTLPLKSPIETRLHTGLKLTGPLLPESLKC